MLYVYTKYDEVKSTLLPPDSGETRRGTSHHEDRTPAFPLAYFTTVLGFELIEDTPLDGEKRWVLIAPPRSQGTRLLLARAVTTEQASRVGNQTGGRVFLFLQTDNFWRDYHAMKERGANFQEVPREESYGTVAVFQDIYGNRWDLLQLGKHR